MKSFLACLLGISLTTTFAATAQNRPATSGSWSGVVVSSACNADEAFNESPECIIEVPGAKLSLYDDTNLVMYALEPQKTVTARLGDTVTVRGALDGDTIKVASMEPTSIGLAVGKKAPAFSIRDQFGRVQTLGTLKGNKGTLFSSSAPPTGHRSAKG